MLLQIVNYFAIYSKRATKSSADEFVSTEFGCGIKHWSLIASSVSSSTKKIDDMDLESDILEDLAKPLPESRADAATTSKKSCVIVKPLLAPPCPEKVWKWAKNRRNKNKEIGDNIEKVGFETKTPNKGYVKSGNLHDATPVTSERELDGDLPKVAVTQFETPSTSTLKYSGKTASISSFKLSNSRFAEDYNRLTSTPVSTTALNNRNPTPHKKLFDNSNMHITSEENTSTSEQQHLAIPSSQVTSSSDSSTTLCLHSLDEKDYMAPSNVAGIVDNTFAFRVSQKDLGEAKVLHEKQHITVMSMELHVRTRLELLPDPEIDEIRAVFYAIQSDSSDSIDEGCFIIESKEKAVPMTRYGITGLKTVYVDSEPDLFNHLSTLILHVDPDILLGYEVQMLSWGYLLSRAAHLGYDLCRCLSRVPHDSKNNWCSSEKDEFGADNASEIHIVGRLVLNIWRLMRSEVALYDYKFESVAYHLLHQRHPRYSTQTLTLWFDQPQSALTSRFHQCHTRARVIKYLLTRVLGNIQLISQQDIIGRTSELARLFGIQFYEVLTRGSQFRVSLFKFFNFSIFFLTIIERPGPKSLPVLLMLP